MLFATVLVPVRFGPDNIGALVQDAVGRYCVHLLRDFFEGDGVVENGYLTGVGNEIFLVVKLQPEPGVA